MFCYVEQCSTEVGHSTLVHSRDTFRVELVKKVEPVYIQFE